MVWTVVAGIPVDVSDIERHPSVELIGDISIIVNNEVVHASKNFSVWRSRSRIIVGNEVVPDQHIGKQLFIYYALRGYDTSPILIAQYDEHGQPWGAQLASRTNLLFGGGGWQYNGKPVRIC